MEFDLLNAHTIQLYLNVQFNHSSFIVSLVKKLNDIRPIHNAQKKLCTLSGSLVFKTDIDKESLKALKGIEVHTNQVFKAPDLLVN